MTARAPETGTFDAATLLQELADGVGVVDASGEIVLAVIRDDVVHRFDTSDIRILQKGDQLVVIRHSEGNGYHVTPPPAS